MKPLFETHRIHHGLIAIVLLGACGAKAAEPPKSEAVGKTVSLVGKVLIRNEKVAGAQTRPLRVGDPIFEGEVINTSSDANAKILLTDRSVVDIGASTLFKIDEYRLKNVKDRSVELSMKYGRVRTVVSQEVGAKGKYKFRTQTATMGVRGTEFVVQSDLVDAQKAATNSSGATAASGATGGQVFEGPAAKSAAEAKTQITVVQGKVEVAQPTLKGPPVNLTPGTQLTTAAILPAEGGKAAAPAEVKQLSKQELQTVVVQAKVPDRTFVQNVSIDSTTGTKEGGGTQQQSTQQQAQQGQGPGNGGTNPKDGPKDGGGPGGSGGGKPMVATLFTLVAANLNFKELPPIKPESVGGGMQTPFDKPPLPPNVGQPVNLTVVFTP